MRTYEKTRKSSIVADLNDVQIGVLWTTAYERRNMLGAQCERWLQGVNMNIQVVDGDALAETLIYMARVED